MVDNRGVIELRTDYGPSAIDGRLQRVDKFESRAAAEAKPLAPAAEPGSAAGGEPPQPTSPRAHTLPPLIDSGRAAARRKPVPSPAPARRSAAPGMASPEPGAAALRHLEVEAAALRSQVASRDDTIARLTERVRSLEKTVRVLSEAESATAPTPGAEANAPAIAPSSLQLGAALQAMRLHVLACRKENSRLHAQLERFLERESVVDLQNALRATQAEREALRREVHSLTVALRRADRTPVAAGGARTAKSASQRDPLAAVLAAAAAADVTPASGEAAPAPGAGALTSESEVVAVAAAVEALRSKLRVAEAALASASEERTALRSEAEAARGALLAITGGLRNAGATGLGPLNDPDPTAVVAAVTKLVADAERARKALLARRDEAAGLRAQLAQQETIAAQNARSLSLALRSLFTAVDGAPPEASAAIDPAILRELKRVAARQTPLA